MRRPGRACYTVFMVFALTIFAALVTCRVRSGLADDPVAYVSEIHRAKTADTRLKPPGGEWRDIQPLMALHGGDQVQVSGSARVVVLYRSGGATQTVSAATSPFTVPATPPAARFEQMHAVTQTLAGIFGSGHVAAYKKLATRAISPPTSELVLIAPRETQLLTRTPRFEWEGDPTAVYTIRVAGPDGVVWTASRLSGNAVVYPGTAAVLRDGVRYTWELERPASPPQRTTFQIATEETVDHVGGLLASVDRAATEGLPPSTASVLRAAVLVRAQLFDDARRELETALARDRDNPALHFALAHVYQTTGLEARAEAAFERARR